MASFRDRADAGRRLSRVLASELGGAGASRPPAGVVLAVPRGAVVMGGFAAEELGWPLDLVIVRKIGHPSNPEYAVGAVDADGEVVRNPAEPHIPEDYLVSEAQRERAEIARRMRAYRGTDSPPDVAGKTAVIIDDGVATGLTALQAVRYVRRHGASEVVLAVPVISDSALELLEPEADRVIALEVPRVFWAVGAFYDSFRQVSDEEVVRLLRSFGGREQQPDDRP
ncbi:MAG: phosphoribosyltransferase [Coriobacteriia bacterium]